MTVHYTAAENTTLCGTKSKNVPTLTTDKALVDCKRCLKKLNAPVKEVKVAKKNKTVSKGKGNVEYVKHERHGHCLSVGRGTLLRLGKDLNAKVGVMTLGNELGMTSTSMKFAGGAAQLISDNEVEFLRNSFTELKKVNNGVVLVADVVKAFTVETR